VGGFRKIEWGVFVVYELRMVRRGLISRVALIAMVLTIAIFGAATGAHAAGAAVFSAASPASGSAVLTKPLWISVMSDDSAPILYATLKVNGVDAITGVSQPVGHWEMDEETETDYYVVDDPTISKLSTYKSSWAMVNGTNTVAATVFSSSGVSTHSWTFDYVTGTSITTVTPTPDAVLAASPAAISATLASPYSTFTSSMKLDGKVVSTTYSAATKTYTYTPATTLSPGTHTVAFTASAAAGSASRSWSFTVRPPMSTAGDCANCHAEYAASHPRVGCASCHDEPYAPAGNHGSAVPSVAGCMGDGVNNGFAECHQFDHSGNQGVGIGFACADCHDEAYPAVPQHTDTATSAKHTTTACDPCHSGSLITEHAKYPTAAAIKHQCALCHAATAPQKVKDAITAGSTACSACHSSSGHEAEHVVARTDACADCHAGPSLTTVHPFACAGCHESAKPGVLAAIAANDKNCVTCHPGDPHPDADHTVGGPCTTSGCHATDAVTIHAPGPKCAACHGAGKTPTLTCSSCHATAHAAVNHGSTDTCTSCHSTGNLMTIHGDDCAKCHPTPATASMTWTGSCDQSGCHTPVHAEVAGHNSNHGEGDSCWDCHDGDGACSGCHVPGDRTPPITTTDARASYTTLALIRLFPTDTGEWGWASGVRATRYRVDGGALQTGTTVVVNGPASGTETHTLEFWSTDQQYNTEAHKSVRFAITAGGPDVIPPTGSMSVNNGATYANSVAVTINSSIVDGETGIAGMRIDPGSGVFGAWVDYSPTYPVTLPSTNGTKTVRVEYKDAGNNVLARSDMIILDNALPVGTMQVNSNSAYTTSLVVTLTSSVSDSLSGLVDMRFMDNGNWQWGAWEPYSTTKVRPLSGVNTGTRGVYGQYRDAAGNVVQLYDSIIYDPTAPTGTMSVNSNAVYATTTAATINSAVTDVGGSALSQMRVDPGSGTFGSWGAYSASRAFTIEGGEGLRTVRAEYRDGAGNVFSRSDTITLDLSAPTGTMVVANDATSTTVAAVNVNSAMTDIGSGVSQMRVDPGTGVYGGWITYAATYPISLPVGQGLKTVNVQYRDNAGFVATKTDTITFNTGVDGIAPTGSVDINVGASWVATTNVTLTLAATDVGGSGLSQMRFSNDNTNWSSWESYATTKSWVLTAGAGTKTVYVQYRDAALNASSSYTDTIGLDDIAPTTTSNATSGLTYTGPWTFTLTPVDTGGSGVANTWWQLDGTGGSWTSGTSVPVPAPASGTVSHTLYWYSRDNATNQESQKSVTFQSAHGTASIVTTTLPLGGTAFVDGYLGSSGAWGEYRIYADGVLIGTKPANATSTWNCPATNVSSGAVITIVMDCGFDSSPGAWNWSGPLEYTLQLPSGSTRLEAATWGGFQDIVTLTEWWDDYESDYDLVMLSGSPITNIVYATSP